MGLITPDFSEVKDPLTPGTYSARIIGWGNKEGDDAIKTISWNDKRTGEPKSVGMLAARMEVFEAANAAQNGMTVVHEVPLSGGGAFRLIELYEAATGELIEKERRAGFSFDTEQLLGKEVTVTVVKEADKKDPSKEYTRVKSVAARA